MSSEQELMLGTLSIAGKPSFAATIGETQARVTLESSAVLALADHATDEKLAYMLNSKRARIREIAQGLYDQGFYLSREDMLEIPVTALDIA